MGGRGRERVGLESLGLANANWYMYRIDTKSYCTAQRTIFNILDKPHGKEYEKNYICVKLSHFVV